MKNNFRIINILRKLFYFLYLVASLNLVVVSLFNFMTLCFPDFPFGDLSRIHFFNEAKFQGVTSYKLVGGGIFNGESGLTLQLNELQSDQFIYRLFGFIDNLIFGLCTFFLFKYAYRLFDNLTNSLKSGGSFSQESYRNIRQIGFLMFGLWIYNVINGILFSVFLLKDVVVEGIQLSFHLDFAEFGGLIVVLVIFAFAEIYRAGVVMQAESELTI